MSDEEYSPTDEDLLAILNNKALLEEEGYQILPKGHMAMVLMEMGVSNADAEKVAETMANRIFLDGWIYLREDQLKVVDDS